MFDIFTNTVENALDVTEDLLSGELPDKRRVAKLIDAGLTVAAAASLLGVAESAIESLLKD